ncbi:hypothetical protein B9Z19DRAFT_1119396 [Tuber borchii]|uniref:Uncharacterized protein n=1 Tax=Tuber borchii TaxID=42251 RepID=A0A2T7A6P4_TUBBO|nr:hypothetical protein B9Z19DRAFT_1119396 [Tuber borchii]
MSGHSRGGMPERSLPAEISPSSQEYSRAEEERKSRAAEFELRAKSMGITEEKFIAQKVAIWEGMWVAQQSGDEIEYYAGVLLNAATSTYQ